MAQRSGHQVLGFSKGIRTQSLGESPSQYKNQDVPSLNTDFPRQKNYANP